MKKNNKFKKLIFALLCCVLSLTPLLSGCFSWEIIQLDTPTIVLHTKDMSITWQDIDKADSYEIYLNDVLIDTVKDDSNLVSYVYVFKNKLKESGTYMFYIKAKARAFGVKDSEISNKENYIYVEENIQISNAPTTVERSDRKLGFAINGGRVEFAKFDYDEPTCYELYLYSHSTGLQTYIIDSTYLDPTTNDHYKINLSDTRFNLKYEIYAVAVGAVWGDTSLVHSDIKYYNQDKYAPFTDKIYAFDGCINDYYIASFQELENIVYYSFISRLDILQIKLSKSFVGFINNYASSSSGENTASKFRRAVEDSMSAFFETRDAYSYIIREDDAQQYIYTINIKYHEKAFLNSSGLAEPELTNTPDKLVGYDGETYYEEIDWDGFYDTCGLVMRNQDPKYSDNAYDEFVSDKQFVEMEVGSSEELYWAVENRIKPILRKGSRAEEIYNLAKDVLNSIISDDMTDYEKALSIFDWICLNTCYDFYSLSDNCYNKAAVTTLPVYYLEGVFKTGFAVCDGYSKAYSLLCNMEGIECARITGYALGGYDIFNDPIWGGHAWNKVKIDIDPTDDVPALYYLVDITWTTLISLSDNEVSSHTYFMLSDADVATTHKIYDGREKFKNYVAPTNFDYYNNTKFVFDASKYDELSEIEYSENNTYDLVITSLDELQVMFYYMLEQGVKSFETIFDYNFIKDNFIESSGGVLPFTYSYNDMIDQLWTTLKENKFKEQYLMVHRNDWEVFVYNNAGDKGAVVVFEQNLLIDETGEIEHLVGFLSDYELENTYELFVKESMFDGVAGDTELEKVQNLFASVMEQNNINIEFTQFQMIDDTGDKEAGFIIEVNK